MELVIHIELRNTRGAMEVMNQTFELPDAHSDPINEGEEAILEAFTTAQMLAYPRYLYCPRVKLSVFSKCPRVANRCF